MIRLDVHLYGEIAGHLGIASGGNPVIPEDWHFQYLAAYVEQGRPALSVSLSLQATPHAGAAACNWFSNLLPEGRVRDAIGRRLRLPARDDFALLAAIGGECAGAVSIVDAAVPKVDGLHTAGVLVEDALCEFGGSPEDEPWALLGGPLRLSLAGAQDKLAVVRDVNGLRLPAANEPSTHIVKPDSPRMRGLCDYELLGLKLAAALKLPAASAELVTIADTRALLVERFDRVRDDGQVFRLHQEDFCQALGLHAELKYQSHGGPTLAACAHLIRERLRLGPVALQAFLDWVIFIALIGNADAHGKNLALLRPRGERIQLAPFYDLVPTILWPERQLDRTPAMSIGDAPRIDAIERPHWEAFARDCGYAPKFVLRRVRTQLDAARAALPTVIRDITTHGASPQHLQHAEVSLHAQWQRLDDGLAQPANAPARANTDRHAS